MSYPPPDIFSLQSVYYDNIWRPCSGNFPLFQDSRQLRHWPRSVSSNWAAWQASILELSPQQLSQPTLTLEGAAQRQSAVSDSTILDSAGSAQTRAIPTVARPIFLATMIGHVKTIQKLMPACFRSNCRYIWRIFNEMRKAISCYFRPTRAHFKCRTPIFVTRITGYVKTIQNHMLACFRSKNWFAWTILRNWPPWYFSVVTLPSSFENASITILDTQSFMETSLPADELSNALSLEILAHFFIEIWAKCHTPLTSPDPTD